MPIIKTKSGYKYGPSGKLYPTREQAARQGRAIEANRSKRKKKKKKYDFPKLIRRWREDHERYSYNS